MTLEELKAKRARLTAELSRLDPDRVEGHAERQRNLERSIQAVDTEIERLNRDRERIARLARDPRSTDEGFSFLTPERVDDGRPRGQVQEAMRESALRALESRSDILSAADGDRILGVVNEDSLGLTSAYIAGVLDWDYSRAFAKILANPTMGHQQFTPKEAEAFRAATRASEMRELASGGADLTGGDSFYGAALGVGGGALPAPVEIDPTLILTSPGVSDPISDRATNVQITGYKYSAAVAGAVTAAFGQEGTEIGDATPTVALQSIQPQRASAFVQYSIEASQDWSASSELGGAMNAAKQELEGLKFVSGAGEGSYEPQGLVTGATVTVAAGGTVSLALADMTGTQQALSPRFQQNAVWLGNLTTRNAIDQLVKQADSSNARIVSDTGQILHRDFYETNNLANFAHLAKPIIYGDIGQAYRIARRLGVLVEIIPHMLSANRLPLGVRGLVMFWRVSAKVMVPSAVRVLAVP